MEDNSDDSGLGSKPMGTFGVRRVLFLLALLVAAGALVARYWPVERDDLIGVMGTNGLFGLINAEGRIVIDTKWRSVHIDETGVAVVGVKVPQKAEDSRLYIDESGGLISGPWDFASSFDSQDMATVCRNELWGWVNRKGEVVIDPEWEDPSYYSGADFGTVSDFEGGDRFYVPEFDAKGMALVGKRGKSGWIDRSGNVVIKPEWNEAGTFESHDLALVSDGAKYGWIDRKGEVVIPIEWDGVLYFANDPLVSFDSKGWAMVQRNGKCGWIDQAGAIALPLEWDNVGRFDSEGLAPVQVDSKWGWINRRGEIVIEAIWEDVSGFDEGGMARVHKDGLWGWIDRKGAVVIEPFWTRTEEFDEAGLAKVFTLDCETWVDRGGTPLILPGWKVLEEQPGNPETPIFVHKGSGKIYELPILQMVVKDFDQNGLAIIFDGASNSSAVIDRKGEERFTVKGILGEFSQSEMAIYVRSDPRQSGNVSEGGIVNTKGDVVCTLPQDVAWMNTPYLPHVPKCPRGYQIVAGVGNMPPLKRVYADFLHWLGLGDPNRVKYYYGHCRCYRADGKLIWSSEWVRFETKCWWLFGLALTIAFFGRPRKVKRRALGTFSGSSAGPSAQISSDHSS